MNFYKGQPERTSYHLNEMFSLRMETDEETAPNVRLIFELAGRGCTSSEIIQELYERKIPTPGEYKASKGRKIHDVSRTHQI